MNYLNPAYMFTIEQDDDADLEELIYLAMASKNMRERVVRRERARKIIDELGKTSEETFNKIPDRLGDTPLYNEMKVQVRDKTTGRYTAVQTIPGMNKIRSIDARITDKLDRIERGALNKSISDSDFDKTYNELVDSSKLEISVIDKEVDRLTARFGATGPAKDFLARSYRGQVKKFNEVMTEDALRLGKQFKQLREEYNDYAKELGRQTSLLVYKMLERMLDKIERKSRMM